MAFGKEIKRLREESSISAEKLAERIGLNAARLRKWEQRDLDPRLEDAQKIESFFRMPIQRVMELKTIKEFLKVPRETSKPAHWRLEDEEGAYGGNKAASLPDLTVKYIKLLEEKAEAVVNLNDLKAIVAAIESTVNENHRLLTELKGEDKTRVHLDYEKTGKSRKKDKPSKPLE